MSEITYKTQRRVEFSDTDMAGIAHFSNYFRYMEEVEHEFLRSIGLNVVMQDERGTYGFPKLQAHSKFRSPARLDSLLDIEVEVNIEAGKTIRYDFRILDAETQVADGYLVVACCRFPNDGPPFAIPIPDRVLDAIATSASAT